MNLIIEKKTAYSAIKLNGISGNVGLISKGQRESNGETCCYFNINIKGLKTNLKNIFDGHKSHVSVKEGPAKGGAGGSGWVGYIKFEKEGDIINWLENAGYVINQGLPKRNNSGSGQRVAATDNRIKSDIDYLSWVTGLMSKGNLTFDQFYEKLVEMAKGFESHRLVEGESVDELNRNWPNNCGVYVVRKKFENLIKADSQVEVLYVGMAGKFDREGRLPKKAGLKNRVARITPYCFTQKGDHKDYFEYSPLKTDPKKLKQYELKVRYKKRCRVSEICVDCFIVDRKGTAAPAFLEALILQFHLRLRQKLPVANNSF